VTGCGAYCFGESSYYANTFTLTLGNQKLVITTPNHGSNKDEHYLRPKGTIQTITDDNGTVWRYTINGDREMTLVDLPGDANDVAFSYDSNHRVTAVDTADGRWTYSYTTPGDYGTTTVINPLGETTYVRYNRDKGYITEHRNALNQTTYYYYDSGERLTQVTYPEGNAVNFQYDERGNILTRTDVPKQGSATITQTAFYGTGCPNRKTCNRPQYIIDGNGNRTDFEYGPVGTVDEPGYGLIKWPIPSGNSRPKTVRFPAAQAGGIRPETRNEYFAWLLTKTSICQTTANCQGTADEVVTTYNFNGTEGTTRLLFEKTVAWNGQTLRTCYSYDDQGRRVSETPPLANLSSCPSNIVASPAANAVAPVAAFARTTPTYPDSTPPPIPPAAAPIAEPAPPACGPGTGVLCQ
jgi:YD repeat-containing protein